MSKPYRMSLAVEHGPASIKKHIELLQREIVALEKKLAANSPAKAAPAKVDPVKAYEAAIAGGDKKAAAALFKQHKAELFNSRQGKPFIPTK